MDYVRPDDERKLLVGCAVTKISMRFVDPPFHIAAAEWYAVNHSKFAIANKPFVNESKYVRQAENCQDVRYLSSCAPGLLVR